MNASLSFPFSAVVILLVLSSGPALHAQDAGSRQEEVAAAQEQKARTLSPYKPGFFERRILDIEHAGGFGVAHGIFVAFGDIKRGSGFSMGPAYGKTFANGSMLVGKAVYSIRNAKVVQVALHGPPLAARRLTFGARVRWQDVPEVPFHGIAPGVAEEEGTYSETLTEAGGTAAFRPVRLLRFGAGLALQRYETAPGRGSQNGQGGLFAGVPGVGANPRYVHSYGSAAIDSRDGDGYSRHGSLLRATLHDYRQQDTGPYSFRRVDGVAEQYVPLLRGNWVIYLGARGSTTTTGAGESVPFFLLPDLGGSDLRGYDSYRFRGRHSMLLTAEYRWYAQEFLDGAIFYDAGKTVSRRGDLDFSGLKRSYGAGIRLHGPQTTALRLEVARSREGTRLIIAFSPVGG